MSADARRQAVERHRETLEKLAELDVAEIGELSDAAGELLADVDAEDGDSG